MTHAIWQYRPQPDTLTDAQIAAADNSSLLAKLMIQRGVSNSEAMQTFLQLEAYQPTSGMELPDMHLALQRIQKALDAQEPILIYGDFDVDGITGTSVLLETLRYLEANVSYYIPDRSKEGHGLHAATLCRLISSRHIKLVISTDTGITNFNEVSLLNNLGVSTVVTDHHELPENLPPSAANINPQLLKDKTHLLSPMAGVGVAYKLCELLLAKKNADPAIAERLLDLVAIGTVADVAPLLLENRYLVYRGLQVMNQRQRLGLRTILELAGVTPETELTSETIGFVLGPRLNAIGRLENANDAVTLLTTQDPDEAKRLANQLEALNRRRKELCEKTLLEAEQFLRQIGVSIGVNPGDRRVIVLASPDWHLGVIGIVASRLIERYRVPVFLMVHNNADNTLRCSARSIAGFPLVEALQPLTSFFSVFGGHAAAGGFTMQADQYNAFREQLYALTEQWITPEMMKPIIHVDAILTLPELNPELVRHLSRLAPFGKDNPSPVLAVKDAMVSVSKLLNNQHLKLILTNGGKALDGIEALYWRLGERAQPEVGDTVDVVGALEINSFNNTNRVQLVMQDFSATGHQTATMLKTEIAAMPASFATLPTPVVGAPSPSGLLWVDHRHRERLESFIGQLLTDGNIDRLVYHEGRSPNIPFLQPQHLGTRHQLRPAKEVVFWDFPPDHHSLNAILSQVKPTVIHWAGGKYQSVPVFPSVTDFLKVMMSYLNRLASGALVQPVEVASHLSTTPLIISTGLLVLRQMGYLTVDSVAADSFRVSVLPPQTRAKTQAPLELLAFQQALIEAGRFRDGLLTRPLEMIQAQVQS